MKMKRGLGTGRTAWINAATLLALIDRIFWSTRHVNGTQAKEMHVAIPEVVCDPLSCKANHLLQLGFTAYRSYGVMFKNHEEFMVREYWKLAS